MLASMMVIGVHCSPEPNFHPPPPYGAPPKYDAEIPHCSRNTTKTWCLEDSEYPLIEVQQALDQHYHAIQSIFKDTLINTIKSVDGIHTQNDEVYLCPSSTGYIQPLRAINVDGKWRTIVNRVESYGIKFTQTGRVEECNVIVGNACPLVAPCYQSKCVQKNVFHRFLVFDPYDYTFPFAIEKFKLPGSCGCVVGAFHI